MESSKNYVVGIFNDEDVLLHAVEDIRGKGVKIEEVYSPFPVHGLDEMLGYKRSRLPIASNDHRPVIAQHPDLHD